MLNRKEVEVSVDDIIPFNNKDCKGFTIEWHGNIGWGQYRIYKDETGVWHADSEYMDSKDDMWFLKLLMADFIDKEIGVVR